MKKDDTYKDKGLRVAVQHKNDTAGKMTLSEDFTDRLMQRIEQQDEKPVQHRMKFWPWIAAACVAAFLVVLLAPPRKEAITEPQIAKVEPKAKSVEVKTAEPEERHLSQAISPIKRRKKRPKIEHPRSTDISTSEDEALSLTAEVIVPTAEKTMVSTNRPMRTIHIAPEHVVYVNDGANQVPTTEMLTVSDLRMRGQRLTLEVKQQMQETNPF
jgi:hypothetical protein